MDRFRYWIIAQSWEDYLLGNLSESVASVFDKLVLHENDYKKQGYVFLKTINHGPYRGQSGWWHPQTKDIQPISGAGEPSQPQQQSYSRQGGGTQTAQAPANQRVWTYAKVIARDNPTLPIGREIAVSKRPDGNWDYVHITPNSKNQSNQVIPGNVIAQTIQSIRKDNQPLSTYTPSLDDLNYRFGNQDQDDVDDTSDAAADMDAMSKAKKASLADIMNKGDDETKKGGRPSPENVRLSEDKMTPYNKAVEAKFTKTPEDIMVDALAGTGKTTMLKHLSSFIKPGERWLYLVFNKKNQVESANAFPKGVDVMTTHTFLGQLLKQNGKAAGGLTTLPPREAKWQRIKKILDKMAPPSWPQSRLNYINRQGEEASPFHWKAKGIVNKLASLAKNTAINPNEPNAQQNLMKIINTHAIDTDLSTETKEQDRDYTPDMLKMTLELLRNTLPGQLPRSLGEQDLANVRDQDDTLWYAALNADSLNWKTGYDVILLDEVQDFNRCQLVMAKKLQQSGSRVIAVGDPNQAMYLFRGSDGAAFEELKQMVGGGQSLSLPMNFRSGGNIIDWVTKNTHVKNLQAAPHLMGKGEVYANGGTKPPLKYEEFMTKIQGDYASGGRKLPESTAIISRTNAPLAAAALQLLRNNVNFQIVGKDLSRDLVDHIKKVSWNKPETKSIEDFHNELGDYLSKLSQRWGHKISKQDELKEIEEFTSTLSSVLEYLHEKDYRDDESSRPMETAKDLITFIEKKMGGVNSDSAEEMEALKNKDPRTFVTLTTAHKSKGLEWDTTFLLKPEEYSPNKKNIKTEEQKQQELNAWYVAATRGRNNLYVSGDDKP